MSFSDHIGDLDDAVFAALSDTVTATYIPAAEVATWSATKTSTAYKTCAIMLDRVPRQRFEGQDFVPAGQDVEARVRKSQVSSPEAGAQFYVASGTWAGRWQIIERPEFDGTVYVLGVRGV